MATSVCTFVDLKTGRQEETGRQTGTLTLTHSHSHSLTHSHSHSHSLTHQPPPRDQKMTTAPFAAMRVLSCAPTVSRPHPPQAPARLTRAAGSLLRGQTPMSLANVRTSLRLCMCVCVIACVCAVSGYIHTHSHACFASCVQRCLVDRCLFQTAFSPAHATEATVSLLLLLLSSHTRTHSLNLNLTHTHTHTLAVSHTHTHASPLPIPPPLSSRVCSQPVHIQRVR